ncbi:MAG TPA: type II toxin-antitoxin system VapC family toxin [Chitinophagaceae bacterium]|nr:type II toxin-antitoxin system VapC family toxin [Chitinophagaceae bacterium]
MVIHETVLVDSDILIKAYRGDKIKQKNLRFLKSKYCISVITACELINGARSINRRAGMNKLLQFYHIAAIDEKISELALTLFKRYSFNNNMKISDSFIAATAICNYLLLYTDNKKDFDFIKEIQFYKEK